MKRKVVQKGETGGNSRPFKYMVNKRPSRSVVFTLLVGKQIDTGGV